MKNAEQKWMLRMIILLVLLLAMTVLIQVYFVSEAYNRTGYHFIVHIRYGLLLSAAVVSVLWCRRSKKKLLLIIYLLICILCFYGLNQGTYYTVNVFNVTVQASEEDMYTLVSEEPGAGAYEAYSLIPDDELTLNKEYDWLAVEYHESNFGSAYYIKEMGGFSGD